MVAKKKTMSEAQRKFVTFAFGLTGLSYLAAGAALILIPAWFLENVGRFEPFNRHYMGDAGVFVLAIGLGIWLLRKDLWAHKSMLLAGLAATQLHALNHLYDALFTIGGLEHWLRDALPNTLIAGLYPWRSGWYGAPTQKLIVDS
ncbi:MAG: hypothetical protein WEE20_06205 [Bacteroidota bacterium]